MGNKQSNEKAKRHYQPGMVYKDKDKPQKYQNAYPNLDVDESDSDDDIEMKKNKDDNNYGSSYHNDFANWFKQIQVSEIDFKENKIDKIEYPNSTFDGESGGDEDTEEQEEGMIQLVLDMLGIDHPLQCDKISENYLCALGDSNNMIEENINQIIQSLSDNMPCAVLSELMEDNKNDDDDDDGLRKIPQNIVKSKKIPKGCMANDWFIRTLIDSIKCRVGLEPFIQFDLGCDEDIQLTLSDLIALLLELCNINTHKKLLIPIIEQQIPIPINYVMASIETIWNDTANSDNTYCCNKFYCRDIMYLASQSKVLCDGMSQTEILRDRPLIMFIGSSNTEGKSTLLMNLFDKQRFNILESKNIVHNTSIDLVYLPERHEANYHIIDVHGVINDTLFYKATNFTVSRINLLTYLASLCHVVVFQITESELNKSMKTSKAKDLSVEDIFNNGCSADDVMNLYTNIRKYKNTRKDQQYVLIIRDVANIKKGADGPNIFKCPKPNKRKGQDALRIELRKKLDEFTKDIKLMKPSDLKWWQEIDVSYNIKHCGLLPLNTKRLFSNMDIKDKQLLVQFRNDLTTAVNCILIDDKDRELPFIKMYDEFSMEFKKPLVKRDDNKLRKMIVQASQKQLSRTLKLFWTYCLPNFMNTSEKFNKKQKNKNLWLRSEFMYILDDICTTRNRNVLYEPRQKMKELKAKRAAQIKDKKGDNDEDEKALRDLARIEQECQIGGYDFYKSVQAICNFTYQYKIMLESRWSQLGYKIRENVKLLQEAVMQLNQELFISGVPIEFCDGDYIRMNEEFVSYIFQNKKSESVSDKKVACIAVAGPQSTGKSTLLRRLFGIEARASAGRTTKGINCCGINGDKIDVLLVDTEGIGAPERISKNTGKLKEKRRDNKIVLSALASARVFILNIMRDAKDTKMLDVILWAYEKLNPHQQTRGQKGQKHSNYKQLNDIKFIFVIRDVEEYTDPKWLNSQINSINQHLKESLMKSPSYTKALENDDQKMPNITIQDIIGDPIYFPMPSAFERGSPNPEFAKKCIELRSIIFKYLHNTNQNNSYRNRIQWSNEMCQIWDRIVKFEDVLSPADFRTQSDHQHMMKQVQIYLKLLRQQLRQPLANLEIGLLQMEHHEERCNEFNQQFRSQYQSQLLKLAQTMKTSKQNEHVNESIRDQYVQEFKDRSLPYFTEQIDLFNAKSNRKRVLNVENEITQLLNTLKSRLKTQKINDIKYLKKEYDRVFENKLIEFDNDIKGLKQKQSITDRFIAAYHANILQPNAITGRIPCSEQNFDISFQVMRQHHTDFIEKIQYRAVAWVQNVKYPDSNGLKKIIMVKCGRLIEEIIVENYKNQDFLTGLARRLDKTLDQIDIANKDTWRLSEDFRAASHTELRLGIRYKLGEIEKKENDKVKINIMELQYNKWQQFRQDVLNLETSKEKAHSFVKDTLHKEILLYAEDFISVFANDFFSSWGETLRAKEILLRAFRDSFGSHQKNGNDAFDYILNQERIISKEFEAAFANKTKELINSKCRTKLRKEIEIVVNKWIDFFKKWEKDIKKKKFTIKIENTTILQNKLQNAIKYPYFKTICNEAEITDAEIFISTVLDNIYDLKEMKKTKFTSLISSMIAKKKENLKIKSMGCMNFCPCCGAKCELENKHSKNHATEFHLLCAFAGSHNRDTLKLTVDVCSSKANQTKTWNNKQKLGDKFIPWPDFIYKCYPKWYPIDDKGNFDKENVLLMVKMFFDKGLQNKMMTHSRWSKYTKQTRDGVSCKDEIGWTG